MKGISLLYFRSVAVDFGSLNEVGDMCKKLPKRLEGILKEIVLKYHPEWFGIFQDGTPPLFTSEQRSELQEACAR